MSGTLVRVGENLPVSLLLFDGATGKFPQVTLYKEDGTALSTSSLVHRANGLYTLSVSVVMPNEAFVIGVFITYDDAGHTIESATHVRVSDVYTRSAYVASDDVIDAAVDVATILKRLNALAKGKIIRTSNTYAYRDEADAVTLFSNQDGINERLPV